VIHVMQVNGYRHFESKKNTGINSLPTIDGNFNALGAR